MKNIGYPDTKNKLGGGPSPLNLGKLTALALEKFREKGKDIGKKYSQGSDKNSGNGSDEAVIAYKEDLKKKKKETGAPRDLEWGVRKTEQKLQNEEILKKLRDKENVITYKEDPKKKKEKGRLARKERKLEKTHTDIKKEPKGTKREYRKIRKYTKTKQQISDLKKKKEQKRIKLGKDVQEAANKVEAGGKGEKKAIRKSKKYKRKTGRIDWYNT